jgi:hypothetical protein
MVNFLCVFLWIIFQAFPVCSSDDLFTDTHTPEAGVRLAHSDPIYNNVGILDINSMLRGRATVTYIGGRTCLTSAHCFQGSSAKDPSFFRQLFFNFMYRYMAWFKPKMRVGFEVDGKIAYYNVVDYHIHPDYVSRKAHVDLAIIQLDRDVTGVDGLPLSYDFGMKGEEFQSAYEYRFYKDGGKNIPNHLTYVGYGGERIDSLSKFDYVYHQRTACQSFLICVSKNLGVYWLASAGHGVNLYSKNKTEHESERRPLLPYETGLRSGMSGGPTFCDGKVVGINAFDHIVYVDAAYLKETNLKIYKNSVIQFVNFFLWCLGWNSIAIYPVDQFLFGLINVSIPLGPHQKWIEDTKKKYDKGLVDVVFKSEFMG